MLPIEEPNLTDEEIWSKGTEVCHAIHYNWSGHKDETPATGEFLKFAKGRIKLHMLGTDHRCCHIYLCMN